MINAPAVPGIILNMILSIDFYNLKPSDMNIIHTITKKAVAVPAMILLSMLSFQAFAQEKGVDININVDKKENEWYKQPWVWVLAGAVFILLLVAILRGNKNK